MATDNPELQKLETALYNAMAQDLQIEEKRTPALYTVILRAVLASKEDGDDTKLPPAAIKAAKAKLQSELDSHPFAVK